MSREIPATSYLILAMRERWLNLILDGKKTAEVRRTRPARPCDMPDYLYLYHRGHIHGMAEVRAYTVPDYPELVGFWHRNTCAIHHKRACLTGKEMLEYLNCAAAPVVYLLGRVGRFEKPIPVPCRPQSWQYATPELLDMINGNGDQQ